MDFVTSLTSSQMIQRWILSDGEDHGEILAESDV